MRYKKHLAELSSDIWSDWHQAQANRHPSHYKDVLKHHDIQEETREPSS